MARSVKQIESSISEVKRRIVEAQRLQTIATFAGADQLLSLFKDTEEFYDKIIHSLDENNPALAKEYAKAKNCMVLIDGFINGMTGAEDSIVELKRQFLDLNGELQQVQEAQVQREKNRM